MTESFQSNADKRMFIFICMTTFLSSLSISTLTFLSILLTEGGYSHYEIGVILSAPLIPILFALLGAGAVLRKISCISLMAIGQALVVLGFVGIEHSIDSFFIAAIFRALIGLGVGFYFSASMIFVRGLLKGPRTIYLFGVFSSMMPLPNAIGPSLAEWYFRYKGAEHFFLFMAIPAVLSLIFLLIALEIKPKKVKSSVKMSPSYLKILLTKRLFILGVGVFSIGLMWGFVIAYMSLYLSQHHINIGLFFAPMSLVLFGSRFGFISLISHINKGLLSSLAFALIASSFVLMIFLQTSSVSVIAGIFFGFGYSLGFPVLSVWLSDVFDVESRPAAMSLFNTYFHCGIFGIPFIVGMFDGQFEFIYSLAFLVVIAISMGLYFYFSRSELRGMEVGAH